MSYLKYIEDAEFEEIVKHVLDKGIESKGKAERKFTKNVIDPFGSLFEVAAFEINHHHWKNSEIIRQRQKTLQNHVGEIHQKLLGFVSGWDNMGIGSVIDLKCKEKQIIAEVKNKYNTVTGGKLADQYYSLERLVTPKASEYRGYTAYFVNIIPRKPGRFNKAFTPSDKEKGTKCPENESIRIIDGASFYSLVTGDENALNDFYYALPHVIETVFKKHYEKKGFRLPDKNEFAEYYRMAFLE